ncbi:peptidase C69 [Anoxybacter fermentans]|uniref:Peptidase C69 n=1 Tax=Anoxybacter fermentans TaxID=1323375 RepID=A0A3Q9HPW4_9FIRM|nr:TldD/PmbA family protein [Anoxybacter fermentans]AZR72867.1 peptidase C69 [Anoxybacter fermentans]
MKEKILKVLEVLKKHRVDYADIRVNDIMEEKISTENLKVRNLSTSRSRGYGIRVYLDGSMGFAASQDFDKMEETALKALEIAKASRLIQHRPIQLAPKEVVIDHYETPIKIDPFTISKKEKLDLLFEAEREMRRHAELFRTLGSMDFRKEEKIFADTEGSFITQKLYESGCGIEAIAANENDMQSRSYPNSFRGNFGTSGYEYILEQKLVENAGDIAKEAAALLEAEECPSGVFDIIIDGSQLALQIHESIGHPIELDRVFGSEADFAGTSFLSPDMIGFKYGSEYVNVVADATVPLGLGTFGYDDDGVKAQRTEIITKGIFKNFLTSRETASLLNQPSNGTNRADGWGRAPIVRMTNINLLPGDKELDELIAGIDYGFFFKTNKSWSIDDKRLNFQFGCEIAYEIKDGKLTGKIFKNPIYTGITPEFWASCDGVCNEKYWKMYGTPNCGKGQPLQIAHVGHGAAPARFRNIKVGVADVK